PGLAVVPAGQLLVEAVQRGRPVGAGARVHPGAAQTEVEGAQAGGAVDADVLGLDLARRAQAVGADFRLAFTDRDADMSATVQRLLDPGQIARGFAAEAGQFAVVLTPAAEDARSPDGDAATVDRLGRAVAAARQHGVANEAGVAGGHAGQGRVDLARQAVQRAAHIVEAAVQDGVFKGRVAACGRVRDDRRRHDVQGAADSPRVRG